MPRTNLQHLVQQEQLAMNDSASNFSGQSNFENNIYAGQKIALSNPLASIDHDYKSPPVTLHFPSERDCLSNTVHCCGHFSTNIDILSSKLWMTSLKWK